MVCHRLTVSVVEISRGCLGYSIRWSLSSTPPTVPDQLADVGESERERARERERERERRRRREPLSRAGCNSYHTARVDEDIKRNVHSHDCVRRRALCRVALLCLQTRTPP
jgi:hypothetical protein